MTYATITTLAPLGGEGSSQAAAGPAALDAREVYQTSARFVWRTLRRLGVPLCDVDDAVQEVFLVVHRRRHDFEGRAAIETWLFAVARNVAMRFRERARRTTEALDESIVDGKKRPDHSAEEGEAVSALYALLEELDEEKRTVFILAELEQWSAPEISTAVGAPVNTVYSRLRAARAAFQEAVQRRKARNAWRGR